MYLSSLFAVLGVVFFIGTIVGGIRIHLKRKEARRERMRLARLRRDSGSRGFGKPAWSNPYGTWRGNHGEIRRRRQEAPKGSPHMYNFKFTL